jgi:hypothetical protein
MPAPPLPLKVDTTNELAEEAGRCATVMASDKIKIEDANLIILEAGTAQ